MRSPTILVRGIARTALAVIAAALPAACHAPSADTALLGRCLTGSFSSQQQAAADPEFRDIRLHIVPIWTHRPDGPWLYVEQAAAEALDKPYRQRVYRLSQTGNDTFRSDVYLLPEPALGFAGAFAAPEPLASISPAQLILKDGCAVFLSYNPRTRAFEGGTRGQGCESNLRGAAYATSQVSVFEDRLISWDRGFDRDGQQVWGAVKGGYIFTKLDQVPR